MRGRLHRRTADRLRGSLSRRPPESLVRRLTGYPVRSGTGCGPGCLPIRPPRSLIGYVTRNDGGSLSRSLLDYEASCPLHEESGRVEDRAKAEARS